MNEKIIAEVIGMTGEAIILIAEQIIEINARLKKIEENIETEYTPKYIGPR